MPDAKKQKVAIVHGLLGSGRGGSEARAMWAAEALKRDFAVSLVAAGPIDLNQLNLFYGTRVGPQEVTVCSLSIPALLAGKRGAAALRYAFLSRALKDIALEHDVLISTYNLCDFGVRAIQCVADFSWDEELRRRFDPPPLGIGGLFHRIRWLRASYLGLCRTIAPPSGRNLFSGDDMIVANSRWTATKLRERYGIVAGVVYPPVTGEFSDVPRECRRNDFVCIGRISPEKRIERMIRIVGSVRGRGHDVRIRIIGSLDNSPYSKTIASLAQQHHQWVLLEGLCVGEQKTKILAACRYGIHGREGEAFGIGVAEMVKAGCITFVPAEGGPAEIVRHEALLYRDDGDAAEKISAGLSRERLREELGCHLRLQADRFSPEHFMSGLRFAVGQFIESEVVSRRCQVRTPKHCAPAQSP